MEQKKRVKLLVSPDSINSLSLELGLDEASLKEEISNSIAENIGAERFHKYIVGSKDKRILMLQKAPKWKYVLAGDIVAMVSGDKDSITVAELPKAVTDLLYSLTLKDARMVLDGDADAKYHLLELIENASFELAAACATA